MGGGILYAPGKIAALLPNAWLYMAVWIFGGINALLGATVFAELGAMIPLSGGPYPFARRALGDYAGFFVGYTQWALDCASDAALLLLVWRVRLCVGVVTGRSCRSSRLRDADRDDGFELAQRSRGRPHSGDHDRCENGCARRRDSLPRLSCPSQRPYTAPLAFPRPTVSP